MKFSAMKSAALLLFLCAGIGIGGAATVTVGPSGQYASPCVAFPHLSDGDMVQIDANSGTPYMDTGDCYIRANNVTVTGMNGRPIMDALNAGIAKGIWVVDGHDVVIDNFEFRNAKYNGSSGNAAGIRIEDGSETAPAGGNITVERCYLHDNGDGILGANAGPGVGAWNSANPYITFQYDEFANNGDGSGSTHNMYMGSGGNLNFTIQYSWSHDSYVGHTVKTRAPYNNLLYNLIGDNLGNTSYVLDFPLGGSTYIVGNVLYKSQTTNPNSNTAMMIWRDVNDNGASDPEYGPPNEDLHFINNTMVNDPANTFPGQFVNVSCFDASTDTCAAPANGPVLSTPAVVENNIFVGPATTTEATNQPTAVVHNNILLTNTPENLAALFVDPAHFDYHLVSGSPAIGAGVYPPTDNTGAGDPKALAVYEYVHPSNMVARPTPTGSTMDAGAYSYPRVGTPPSLNVSATTPVTVPNTGTITVTGLPTPPAGQYNYVSFVSENTNAIPYIVTAASSTGTVSATFQTLAVASDTVVPIDVYAKGAHATTSVTVVAGPPVLSSVTIDGPYYPQSSVHLLGGSTTPIVINLSSSDSSTLFVPPNVTIPAGQLSAETGSINGSLWGQTPGSKNATLTASYGGVTKTLVINVAAPFIHNFYCNISPCTVVGGQQAAFQLVMAGDYPPGGGPVIFTSDNPAAIPNQTVNIGEGQFNDNLNVNTNAVTANTTVNVTINVNGATWTNSILVTPSLATIAAVSGSGQTAAVGTNFANPLVVLVKDGNNSPLSGATVTFAGSGVSFPGGATAVTNSSGQAQVTAQPTGTGALTITATATGVGAPASFTETGTAGAAASIATVSGSGQSSAVGTSFPNPLVVVVKDSSSNPVSGATVTFAGSGVSFPSGATAVTNSSGDAQVTAQPTTSGALTITASVAGVGTPASFSETGTSSVAISSITQDSPYQSGTTVHLTAAAPTGGAVISLSTSDSSIEYVPASVTVPAGQTSAETGSLLGSLWGQTPTSKTATVTGIYGGVTKTLTMNVPYTSLHSFAPNSSVQGGQPLGFYVETAFNPAPVGGAPYTISSDHASIIPTQSFTLAAGQSNDFGRNLSTNAVSTTTTVNITLNYNGALWGAAITVTPGPNAPASIATVSGSGQSSPVGTNFTNPLVVVVKNSSGGAVSGATVTFAGSGVSFPSGATATTNASGLASVTAQPTSSGSLTVTASVAGVGTPASFSETGTSPVAISSITQDSQYQSGTTVHLTAAAPAGGAVVSLSSSDSSIEYVPATVTVPAGQTSAETGSLLGSLWGQTPTSKSATVTGIYGGVTKTLTMNVPYTSLHSFNPNGSVKGGQPLGFYVETAFNPAPVGGATYSISSDHPSIIPTQSFTLAAGQSNDFGRNLTTNAVSSTTTVNITLNYNGALWGAAITVTP